VAGFLLPIAGLTTASIGTVGSDASHGVFELVDLVAEMIARLRIDDGDGGRNRKTCGLPDRTRSARRDLHDPGAEADPPIGQSLSLLESAADEFDDSRILGLFAVIEKSCEGKWVILMTDNCSCSIMAL
jgi:hypothetical protein